MCIAKGLKNTCGVLTPGVVNFNWAVLSDVATVPAHTNRVIGTDITMVATKQFQRVETMRGSGMFKTSVNKRSGKTELEFQHEELRAALIDTIENVAGADLILVWTDENGRTWTAGTHARPVRLVSGEGDSGKAGEDFNGATLKFECGGLVSEYTGVIPIAS